VGKDAGPKPARQESAAAPKAIVAMAHHLARLIYRLIKCGQPYLDKGMEVYEAKYRQQRIKLLQK
jgi:transposase